MQDSKVTKTGSVLSQQDSSRPQDQAGKCNNWLLLLLHAACAVVHAQFYLSHLNLSRHTTAELDMQLHCWTETVRAAVAAQNISHHNSSITVIITWNSSLNYSHKQ